MLFKYFLILYQNLVWSVLLVFPRHFLSMASSITENSTLSFCLDTNLLLFIICSSTSKTLLLCIWVGLTLSVYVLDVTDQKTHNLSLATKLCANLGLHLHVPKQKWVLYLFLLQSFLWLDEKSYTEEEDFQEGKSLPALWPSGAHWASWTSHFSGA